MEHDLECTVALDHYLTTAIAGTRDPSPLRHGDPSRLRKATDGDPCCGGRASFFPSHSRLTWTKTRSVASAMRIFVPASQGKTSALTEAGSWNQA